MSDNIYGQNVYSLKEKMWHGKGIIGVEEENAMSVYGRMIPVEFEQRPFGITLNGTFKETGKHYGIIRSEGGKEKVIGETKGRYNLTQPVQYATIFDEYVGKAVETMGFLGTHGQKMFITWNLPNIDVHGDKVEMYGFLAVGFDGKFGEKLYETGVRVVCNNTWNMAVSDAQERVRGAVYTAKHSMNDHEERLGIWMRYITNKAYENVEIYQNLFRKMEEKPIGVDEAYGLFAKVYEKKGNIDGSYYPSELLEKDDAKIIEYNEGQEEKRDMAVELFKGAGIEITPTVWGAFNCVTELENHKVKSKKDKTESILLGNRQSIMQQAMDVMSVVVR